MERTEAIEVIRKCWPVNRNGMLSDALETLIPELKESEDERIRKEILNGIQECQDAGSIFGTIITRAGVTYLDVYAWLEKQKEQKPAVEQLDGTFNSYDMAKTFVEGQYYVMEHPERFGLCKPVEWSDSVAKEMFIKALERAVEQTKKGYELTDCDKHSWWEDFKAYSEIKPAEWSGDDETYLQDALWRIEQAEKVAKDEGDMGACWSARRWLKSLRPQLQQNMSISFMLYLDEIRPEGKMCLSNGECNDIEDAFKKQDWPRLFKYINKYQPHWKPNEEQIKALQMVKDSHCFMYQKDRVAIEKLLEQIKSL